MGNDQEFTRHTFQLLFDLPALLAGDSTQAGEILNIASGRILDLIERDASLQTLFRTHGIEWGIGPGSWEPED